MAHLLEVENLEYRYGNIKALHGLNFYVDEGEIVTLIGTNGAGKTTTMHTLPALMIPVVPAEALSLTESRSAVSADTGLLACVSPNVWKAVRFFLS